MNTETLLWLAERCEQASGADRELDALIFCAVSPSPFAYYGDCIMAQQGGFAARVELDEIPHPTASLDAAMQLVPEGWRWSIFHEGVVSLKPDVAFCGHPDHRNNGIEKRADAATPALALTAACLRARAAEKVS